MGISHRELLAALREFKQISRADDRIETMISSKIDI